MYDIIIKVDTNDGDYVTSIQEISKEELEIIKPLVMAIKNFKPYQENGTGRRFTHTNNYPVGECLRDDMGEKSPKELYDFSEEVFEIFEKFLPYPEYGFHTIESIIMYPMSYKYKLL